MSNKAGCGGQDSHRDAEQSSSVVEVCQHLCHRYCITVEYSLISLLSLLSRDSMLGQSWPWMMMISRAGDAVIDMGESWVSTSGHSGPR